MVNTYEAYLKHPAGNTITMEDALRIYTAMAACIEKCSAEDKMEYWNDFLNKAAKYAYIRNRWETMTREEKIEEDDSRTAMHNSLITAINVLSRIVGNEGVENAWREELGENRKRIGDFGCFVSYITGISNR